MRRPIQGHHHKPRLLHLKDTEVYQRPSRMPSLNGTSSVFTAATYLSHRNLTSTYPECCCAIKPKYSSADFTLKQRPVQPGPTMGTSKQIASLGRGSNPRGLAGLRNAQECHQLTLQATGPNWKALSTTSPQVRAVKGSLGPP